MRRHRFGLALAGLMIFVLVLAGCGRGRTAGPASSQGLPGVSDRGPGMRGQNAAPLQLPVARTLDLTHVEPQHFAVALGNDPARIFEFVRDQVAYEVYSGLLRGPRGTLLAMAGNSVDRAALLASLLQHAGHQVRYARGTLPDREARDLVTSMWATRPEPTLGAGGDNPAAKAAAKTLRSAVERDYKLVAEQLRKVKGKVRRPADGPDALVADARTHLWVQWAKGGTWTDLDPSFSDAKPGQTYTRVEETFETLPEALSHRVVIRMRLEEHTGAVAAQRVVLTHTLAAAELSGRDFVLVHVPEAWTAPAESLNDAVAAAIADTGRIKPVLLGLGDQMVIGAPFRQKLKTGGIGRVGSLLGGEGTRRAAALATAEWLEFEFLSPDGSRYTAIRETFDLVGGARRSAGRGLSAQEVRERTESESAFDASKAAFDLLFMTGTLYAGHLSDLAAEEPQQGYADLRSALRRMSMTVIAASEGVLSRFGKPERAVVLLYPDSPRLVISEMSRRADRVRVALDLRHTRLRAVAIGPNPQDAFSARIARGIVDGTVERLLGEFVVPNKGAGAPAVPAVSTSLVFERAAAEKIPAALLPDEADRLSWSGREDALAAVRKETDSGHVAVAPQHAVSIGGAARVAWWRVDPVSGETVAVTDEGLHAVVTEYHIVKGKKSGEVHVIRMEWVGNRLVGDEMRTFQFGTGHLANYIRELMFEGARLRVFLNSVF